MRASAFLVLLLACYACAKPGLELRQLSIAGLKTGMSRAQAEKVARATLGAPRESQVLEDGRGGLEWNQGVGFLYDRKGVVWSIAGPALETDGRPSPVRRGDSLAQVRKAFGPPTRDELPIDRWCYGDEQSGPMLNVVFDDQRRVKLFGLTDRSIASLGD